MKVFISWSGDISHQVANVLHEWLPFVIQSLEPYVSSEDIDKGARWFPEISKELEDSSYGILCITKDNPDAAWLNFEAGALSKSVDRSRVAPFLFGIERSEIKEGPIAQFQSTTFDEADVKKLVRSLNTAADAPLSENRLNHTFETWWPKLKSQLDEIEGASNSQGRDAKTSFQTAQQIEEVKNLVKELSENVASFQGDSSASPIARAIAAAVRLQQQGKIEEAVEKWRSIANIAGEEDRQLQARAWFSIGYLREEGDDLEAVIDAYTTAIQMNPDSAAAYTNRGVAKARLSQYAAAVVDFDQAIRLKPEYALAYSNRGSAKSELSQHAAAVVDFDQAIRLEPEYALAYYNRGKVKNDLGQYAAAVVDFDQAIRLKPDLVEAYDSCGVAKSKLGQHAAAVADFDQAIRLKPDNAVAYNNRGIAKNDLGQHAAAVADFDQAIRLEPDNAVVYNNRGEVNETIGQYQAALADFDRVIELAPDNAEAYHHRAITKKNLGHINEAREDCQKALDLAQEADNEGLVTTVQSTLSQFDNNEEP